MINHLMSAAKRPRKTAFHPLYALLILLLLAACKPEPSPAPTQILDPIHTAAAETVQAMTTQIVASSIPEPTLIQPVASPIPPLAPVPTALVATLPPIATAGTATALTPQGTCDLAEFMGETVPDGSLFAPGVPFTKTWTLRNAGTCTWTSDYALVFVSGNAMGAPAAINLTGEPVRPGDTLTLTLNLYAPAVEGAYRAVFKLRNTGGAIFAFKDPAKTFWADIRVQSGVAPGAFNLADSLCLAQWSDDRGPLSCPGKPGDGLAAAYTTRDPILENGAQDDENTLILELPARENSRIEGRFVPIEVPAGAAFSAIFGCYGGEKACDLRLTLSALEEGQTPQVLGSWQKAFDGAYLPIRLDLANLAGKKLSFILSVDSNGPATGDKAHLLAPIIGP